MSHGFQGQVLSPFISVLVRANDRPEDNHHLFLYSFRICTAIPSPQTSRVHHAPMLLKPLLYLEVPHQ